MFGCFYEGQGGHAGQGGGWTRTGRGQSATCLQPRPPPMGCVYILFQNACTTPYPPISSSTILSALPVQLSNLRLLPSHNPSTTQPATRLVYQLFHICINWHCFWSWLKGVQAKLVYIIPLANTTGSRNDRKRGDHGHTRHLQPWHLVHSNWW